MDADLKQRWITALRSGKYKQGRYFLRTKDDRFCCLGVLCDVIGVEWTLCKSRVAYAAAGHHGHLNIELLEESGMSYYAMSLLADMNDRGGKSLPQIAAWIEENL